MQSGQRPWGAIVVVYLAGMLQGLTLVSFPASGPVMKQLLGFTDAQYGAIFLPQVVFAVVGSFAGGSLAQRWGLKSLLVATLLANALSQAFLALSVGAGGAAFSFVLLGTASLGLGFGLGGAPLNSYPPQFFPEQRDAAVVALHTLLGLGLTVGPLLVGAFVGADAWVGFPWLLTALAGGLALVAAVVPLPEPAEAVPEASVSMPEPSIHPARTSLFWLFASIAVLYAFAEGTFSNWAVLYLHEGRGVPEATAGFALSVFWGALVAGRLLTSALVIRVPPQWVWISLPTLMIAAFLLLPLAQGATAGIALFALAGLACSSFFPLTISLISRAFPNHVEWVSSMMIAALMVGVGTGSFVFGPLRDWLPFESLYRLSAIYPAVALGLAFVAVRTLTPRADVAPRPSPVSES